MSVTIRHYDHATDYHDVNDFLVETYIRGDTFANWLQPRWEYMHAHEYTQSLPIERFGVAEEHGEIVGIIHFEHDPALIYLQLRPDRRDTASDLLAYAGEHLGGDSTAFEREVIALYVNDFDESLREVATAHGFRPSADHGEVHARYVLARKIPKAPLPRGFHLQSLADENDLAQIAGVLWRGFEHDGEVPESGPAAQGESQQTPGFRRDLTIVAVAPDGTYASYAGMWFVPENRVAYVEPVATDPAYRRMGLARAAVSEALRRVVDLGADVAWVGSDQPLYLDMGFTPQFRTDLWVRALDR
ncbi:MAG: GNAT family N-acetyltransferase [Acidimicrobiia bacterium]